MNTEKLATQVEGHNLIRSYGLEIAAHLIPQLEKIVGKKVMTADGSKTAVYKNAVSEYKKEDHKEPGKYISYGYYIDYSKTGFWIKIKICINGTYSKGQSYCTYFEQAYALGNMENQILTDVSTLEQTIQAYKLDAEPITVEGMAALIQEYEAQKEELSKLYRKIPYQVAQAAGLSNTH
jgi:hypothetical protein